MKEILLAEDIFDQLEKGKETTIRKGRRDINLTKILLVSTDKKRRRFADVLSVRYCRLSNVYQSDLENIGLRHIKQVYMSKFNRIIHLYR